MKLISKKNTTFHIITAIKIVVVLLYMSGCKNVEPDKIEAIKDRSAMPIVHATEITTLISDSGVTRYRISTASWDDYDKAIQPYWEFKNGIHLEKFNLDLKVDANIHSQYARYNKNEQIWELRGKVKATNLQGELFETEQLFWSQRDERIYSDSLIKITQISHIITGIGFESNQAMTKYVIKKPQGIFPISENNEASTAPPSNNSTK